MTLRLRQVIGTAAALTAFAFASPASADGTPPASDDHTWRLVVASIGFIGGGTGTALVFNSFKANSTDAVELSIGGALAVAGVTTMILVLMGDPPKGAQVGLVPLVQTNMDLGLVGRTERLPDDAPGLTVTVRF